MTTVTTDLLDAKLTTVETRLDARIRAIEVAIAGLMESQRELRAEIKSLKITIVITAIATVIGVGAINATIFSNMLTALESGKETATGQALVIQTSKDVAATQIEVKRLLETTTALLDRAEARDRQQARDAKPRRD